MKKIFIYSAFFLVTIGLVYFLIQKNNQEKQGPLGLKDRVGALSMAADWESTKKKADELLAKIKAQPDNNEAKLKLAELYIQEARITGDHVYYDMAAMHYVNQVLEKDSLNFEGVTYKSMIYLSQHHFTDGLNYGLKAAAINPYNAFVYGMLTDAYVELGNYDKAVESADKMMSIRPDLRSYSRVSYLREIYGDYPGAIDAMKMAVEAGAPGDESTSWARVQLGHLYEQIGDMKSAEMHYLITLEDRPNYAYAYAGLGRIAKANKEYKKAIGFFAKADSLVIDYSFKDELSDVYALNGQKKESKEMSDQVIQSLSDASQSGLKDENIGHYADRELAYVYIKANNYDKALEHALAEYNRRPNNIDVNECLAWAYYQKKDFKKAEQYIQVAVKTKSKNPVLLCRAGMIMAKNGDAVTAKLYLQEALKNKPNIAPELLYNSSQLLTTL